VEGDTQRAGDDGVSDSFQDLAPAKRRRLIARAVLRGLLATTVLVAVYYVLPDRAWSADVALRVVGGLVVFIAVTVWQVRIIAGARFPGIKAAEALGLVFPLYLLIFASTYYMMEHTAAASFNQQLSKTDALYFTVTVFSTVGFGDIVPKSEVARVVLIIQMLGDVALIGAGVRILLGAVRRGRQRLTDLRDDVGAGA
jgi:voltage-gated potassium channel